MAAERGLSAVEVSGGMPSHMNTRKPINASREGFFLQQAAAYKRRLSIPIICVHGFRTLDRMREALEQEQTDMISLCRPFIRQPDLIKLFEAGQIVKAACVSCNLCLQHAGSPPIRCWAKDEEPTEVSHG
jgi:2,4-dienoyl-CoA reductase-like NADH-dependent reductase (Old Yellow Enzyme family)